MCTGWRKSGLASLCLASHAIIFPFESDVAFQGFPDSNVSLMSGHTQSPTILYLGTHDVTFMLCPQISDSVFRLDFRKFDLEKRFGGFCLSPHFPVRDQLECVLVDFHVENTRIYIYSSLSLNKHVGKYLEPLGTLKLLKPWYSHCSITVWMWA